MPRRCCETSRFISSFYGILCSVSPWKRRASEQVLLHLPHRPPGQVGIPGTGVEQPELLWVCKTEWPCPRSHQPSDSLNPSCIPPACLPFSSAARGTRLRVLRLPAGVYARSSAPPEHVGLITPVGQPGPAVTQKTCLVVPDSGKSTAVSTSLYLCRNLKNMPNVHIFPRPKFIDEKTTRIAMET